MNIIYSSDNNFVCYLATSICSVCENNKSFDKINFYIMSLGISDINQSKLEKLVNKYGHKLYVLDLSNLHEFIEFDFDSLTWHEATLARLVMARLLPKNMNKIIYLDADTIVVDDLGELWNFDLRDKSIGMSVEPTVNKKIKKNLDLMDYPYHNAGVLLIDLIKWRERDIEKTLLTYFEKNNDKLYAPDQDAINASLKDEIAHLPPKFNFCNIYYHYSYKFLKNLMGDVEYFSEYVYNESMDNPVIIHFIGEEKPWRIGSNHKYKDDYVKYNSLTEWAGEGFEDNWGKFFICWKIFNGVTKPIPSARYFVINNFQQMYRKMMYK